MDLKEALSFIAQQPTEDVVTALQKDANGVWQAVFNKGHSTATAAAKTTETALQTKVTGLETTVAEKEVKIKELETKSPDVAVIHRQYQDKIAGMETAHKVEVAGLKTKITGNTKSGIKSQVRKAAEALGLNGDWVELQLEKAEGDSRIVVKDDGSFDILQSGGQIPLMPAGEDTAVTLLAKELLAKAPDQWKSTQVDGGAGINGNLPGGKQKSPAGAAKYDKIRQEAAEREKARKAANPSSLSERMGISTKTS